MKIRGIRLKMAIFFLAIISLPVFGQESNFFVKKKTYTKNGKFNFRKTISYYDINNNELLYFTTARKKGGISLNGHSKKVYNNYSFYIANIKNENWIIDSSYYFDNKIFDDVPVIGVGKLIRGIQVGEWHYFNRVNKSIFAIVNYNDLGKLNGSYILFDDNKIIVSGVKKENVNQGLFLTYKKGKIIAYYKYDNGLYKGLYQVNKKGKIVMKNKGSAFLDKFYSLW